MVLQKLSYSSGQNIISFTPLFVSRIFLSSNRSLATTCKGFVRKSSPTKHSSNLKICTLYNDTNNKCSIFPVYLSCRYFYFTPSYYDASKLEDSLKEKQKQKKASEEATDVKSDDINKPESVKSTSVSVEKPPLWKRVVAEVKHYYHGFRLLFLDVRIASRTLWKLLRGKHLTRRERNQFRRAVADIFRLAPFSVFIIIPFAEIALPFALKLFPGMLPSTFETSSKRETRLKKELKLKLEMAKFLQDTVEDIAVHTNQSKNKKAAAQKFVEFFKKTRNDNGEPNVEEILQYAKLFKDDLTLDSIERPQLIALCRLIQVPAVGTNEILRLLLQIKLNRLHRDDKLIMEEGVESLTTAELIAASQARGMRALGVSRKRLKQQLSEWVELHVKHDVPSSLLLLSRVLYLPDSVPAEKRVKAAISTLPEKVADEVEVRAAEINLERVDNKTRYKAAKQEQATIVIEEAAKVKQAKEAKGQAVVSEQVPATEQKPDTVSEKQPIDDKRVSEVVSEGPILTDSARVINHENKITQQDIDVLDDAIKKIKSDGESHADKVKDELKELREDIEEYQTDVKTLTDEIKQEEKTANLQNTKAGKRVQKRIAKMIGSIEGTLSDLEKSSPNDKSSGSDAVAIPKLVKTLQYLTKLPEEKLKSIFETLDIDKDGHIDMKEAAEIIQILNKEDVELNAQQLKKIVEMLFKHDETAKKTPEKAEEVNKQDN